jgi:hypothetical protein
VAVRDQFIDDSLSRIFFGEKVPGAAKRRPVPGSLRPAQDDVAKWFHGSLAKHKRSYGHLDPRVALFPFRFVGAECFPIRERITVPRFAAYRCAVNGIQVSS